MTLLSLVLSSIYPYRTPLHYVLYLGLIFSSARHTLQFYAFLACTVIFARIYGLSVLSCFFSRSCMTSIVLHLCFSRPPLPLVLPSTTVFSCHVSVLSKAPSPSSFSLLSSFPSFLLPLPSLSEAPLTSPTSVPLAHLLPPVPPPSRSTCLHPHGLPHSSLFPPTPPAPPVFILCPLHRTLLHSSPSRVPHLALPAPPFRFQTRSAGYPNSVSPAL
ncbi:hypothetical protein B0H11DRAFT_394028 [Mycena galericulata]|nr:hypothetical protein B0H11DRAFT_394028 [Mycena galericulata]